MDWYEPGEDSYAFLDILKKENIMNKIVVDLGCSTGLLTEYLKNKNFVVSADLNSKALIEYRKISNNANLIQMNLLEGINHHKVDVVVFNAPYVPDFDCTILGGGSKGQDVILRFISAIEIKIIYLLVIEANEPYLIIREIESRNYKCSILKVKRVLGETIIILKCIKY